MICPCRIEPPASSAQPTAHSRQSAAAHSQPHVARSAKGQQLPRDPRPERGVGLGGGAGGAGRVRGVEFLLYYNQMIARIRAAWAWPGTNNRLAVKFHCRIAEDGTISDLRLTRASGDESYDASVLSAVRAVSPLGPPPAAHRADFSDVELTFQPADLKSP